MQWIFITRKFSLLKTPLIILASLKCYLWKILPNLKQCYFKYGTASFLHYILTWTLDFNMKFLISPKMTSLSTYCLYLLFTGCLVENKIIWLLYFWHSDSITVHLRINSIWWGAGLYQWLCTFKAISKTQSSQ